MLISNYLKLDPYPLKECDLCKKEEYLYLIYNKDINSYKIGITNDLYGRINGLSTASGIKLKLVIALELEAFRDESAKNLERFLHKEFKNKRNLGEWFNLTIKDIIHIKNFMYFIEGFNIIDNLKTYKNE